jgi:4-amino-4-deoxy-L-arabinose transferase-like glycosyltransferase
VKLTHLLYGRQFGITLLMLIAGSCAFMLMYWITGQGPGVSPDSTIYIEAARSLLSGNGLFVHGKAMTHYPPGYPLLIAGVDLLHPGEVLDAVRFLAAYFFGANLVLLGLASYICTRRSLVATGCAILLFLSSAQIISVHSMAWTEAPFITFSMASFLLFSHHVSRPRRYLLALTGLMSGIAAATRYVGVVLVPSIAVAFFLLDKRPVKFILRDIVSFAGVASLPLGLWFIRNILSGQSVTNREFAFHPVGLDHFMSLISTIHSFILPISMSNRSMAINFAVAVPLLIVGAAIYCRTCRRHKSLASAGNALSVLCIVYSATYVAFISVSISFFDAHTPINSRILLPAILALVIAGIALAWSLSEIFKRRWIWYAFVIVSLFSVGINANPAVARAVDIHKNGIGYTSRYWSRSDIVSILSDVQDSRTIFSNGTDAILFLTGKDSVMIPAKVSAVTRKEHDNYVDELNQMIQNCIEGKAIVEYFKGITWRWYLPSIDEVEATGDLPVLRITPDFVIYGT